MMDSTLGRRLRSAMIITALLMPTLFAFPLLAVLAPSWLRWIIVAIWFVVVAVLVVVIRRVRRLLAQQVIAKARDGEPARISHGEPLDSDRAGSTTT